MPRLPGQASVFALIISSFWAILALFILIIGHLVWVFIAYGMVTNTDAIADLERFLPVLQQLHLYMLAGLALLADIWILISQKNEHKQHLKR
ncbi:MAG TPA: hypothetical protein EYP39_00255 [Ghiorsea sp.]|nr:hypothetical protein [Ghiorsea sp.]HIP07024.1 hypothetical protein [Mariprofundaceae bacterium]